MRSILLFVVATVVMHCDMSDVVTERGKKEQKPSKEQDRECTQRLKDIFMNSRQHDSKSNKLIVEANSEKDGGQMVFQSDIFQTKEKADQLFKNVEKSARAKRLVLRDNLSLNAKWSDGVFYTFNTSDSTVQRLFKMGIKIWSESTCVDFVQDRNAQDKVVVLKGDDCFSDIGRFGGDQLLSLDSTATVKSAVHELGHTLGFYHTMARPDRDNYITIVMQNVDPDVMEEFEKKDESEADVYGISYDYGSIMHYDEYSFSANRQKTIIAKDPFHQKTMGSELISFTDIFMINEHYGCNAKCNKSTSAKCENEGYPHPRNCSICICPSGYGGALCNQRPPGCGEDLTATNETRLIMKKIGNGTSLRDQFDFCNYMITAPEGKKIEVNVHSVFDGYDESGCPRGGVEVKAQKDQKLTGYRFCSTRGSGGPILSNLSRLPVILYNIQGEMGTIFTHRYID